MKSHYEQMLERRTEVSEVTEELEKTIYKKISEEYEEATTDRVLCFVMALVAIFGAGFLLGGIFGKSFLDWGSRLI